MKQREIQGLASKVMWLVFRQPLPGVHSLASIPRLLHAAHSLFFKFSSVLEFHPNSVAQSHNRFCWWAENPNSTTYALD